jgi:RNA polymerase sigma factor (sigma-70 family)
MTRHASDTCTDVSAAAAALYQQHAPTIFAYLRRRAASWEDAEDLLVEVFLAALDRNHIFSVPEEERLFWLQRVAQRKLVDQYRRSTRRPAAPLDEVTETLVEDAEQEPEQVVLRHEAHQHLHQALHRLPASYQEVLRLRFANNLRCAEISTVLRKQEGAVRILLWRALKLLRAHYDDCQNGAKP